MIDDAMWQRDVSAALRLENLFSATQGADGMPLASGLEPTPTETARAVANIRAWRHYLPVACVQTMLDDGWQWST